MKTSQIKKAYVVPDMYVVHGVAKVSFMAGSGGSNPEFNVETNLPGLGGIGGGGNPSLGD